VEDPHNQNLLFTGTDNGIYASLDRGENWETFQGGIPNVAVHDLVIHAGKKHLLAGTHGRSIYLADISHIEALTPEVLDRGLYVFAVENLKHSTRWGNKSWAWGERITPGLDVTFYSKAAGTFDFKVKSATGITVSETTLQADAGLNIVSYDLAFSKKGKMDYQKRNKGDLKAASDGKTYLPKGTYTVVISGNRLEESLEFTIE